MVVCGDCLVEMAKIKSSSIDAVVTDPPYGLEFMGKEWDRLWGSNQLGVRPSRTASPTYLHPRCKNYRCKKCGHWKLSGTPCRCEIPEWERPPRIRKMPAKIQGWHHTWAVEALRVAKPGCHLLAFGGTRTFHRLTCAIEDAGWEIRDCLMWVYGSGFPKSHNLKGEWQGWGTALKPAWEPIILARKPLDGTVAENVQKWGTGAINVDGCRIGIDVVIDASQFRSMNRSARKEKNGWGMNQKSGDTPLVVSTKGRWPANLLHDGSEEVLAGFPNSKSTGGRSGHTAAYSGGYKREFYGDMKPGLGDSGSAARFFYCAKASRAEREMGLEGMGTQTKAGLNASPREYDGQVHGQTKLKNYHPTVKPLALMRYLCRLVTPPGGLILDPFMGSGTTGMAAKQEGFEFIGMDNDPGYCRIAEKRIAQATRQMKLPV